MNSLVRSLVQSGAESRQRVAFLLCLAVLSMTVMGQDRRLVAVGAAAGGRRVALVIGNDTYAGKPLVNARRDARAVATALRNLPEPFTVTVLEDGTQAQMAVAIARFTESLTARDLALFFYAGHGLAVERENYLVPVDYAGSSMIEARLRAIPASSVAAALRAARVAVVVLDACRDNPFTGQRTTGGGLSAMEARGTLIAYATGAGQTASDNPAGGNGVFTQALVATLAEPGLTVTEVFRRVRQQVRASTNDRQWPAVYEDLDGDVILRASAAPSIPLVPELQRREEVAFWESASQTKEPTALRSLLQEYERRYGPNGRFSVLARSRLTELGAPAETTARPRTTEALPEMAPMFPDLRDSGAAARKAYDLYFGTAGRFDRAAAKTTMRAAARGDSFARFAMSVLFSSDPLRDSTAVDRVTRLAGSGDLQAAVLLGTGYRQGRSGLKLDLDEAAKWYKQAADKGSREAINGLGILALDRFVYDDAIRWFRDADARGYPPATANLARLYRDGEGVAKDPVKALELFRRACDATAIMCAELAYQFADGTGVPRDPKQSALLFTKACDAGASDGCVGLGRAYQEGSGVAQDDKRAATLYQQACDDGHWFGCGLLSDMYSNGRGVARDDVRAVGLVRMACDGGDEASCGRFYPEVAKASKDCKSGASGCGQLGSLYNRGKTVRLNPWRAMALFRRACDAGSMGSCFNLGTMYETGQAVPANPTRARELYQKACDAGETTACAAAKRLSGPG